MTVQDNNFIIKNGLSVGTGKHQVLDSNGRITGNYFTLNAGGRYLSAGVDLWDLMSAQGIPPLSTNAWNSTHNSVLFTSGYWDSVYSFVNTDSATNNTDYNRTTFVNVTGDVMTGGLEMSGDLQVGADTYLEGHLRVDGKTYLSAEMYVENDAYVMGNFRADGDVWLAVEGVYPKSIYMGATNDDRVVFRADVDSNIIPDDTITYDLGTSEQQWRELFVHDISATNDVFIDNDLLVSANGTIGTDFRVSGDTVVGGYTELSGTLDVKDFTTLHDDLSVIGDMYVDGNVFLSAGNSGKIVLGTGNDDNVIFQADVDSNIIPDDDVTYDLGTNTQQWRELFVQDISATNDVFIDNDLLVSANGTIGTDFRVSGATVVGGYTELSGTLDVKDFTTLHDDLSVIGDMYVDGSVFLSAGNSGEIVLGTGNDDNVIFQADVDSNIIPDDDVTYDLGTSTQQWRELFVQDISASNDIFVDNDLLVSANGTIGTDFRVSGHTTVGGNTVLSGTLDVKDFTTLHDDLSVKGDLYVDGNAYLSAGVDGNIYVGDVNTDNVIFRADVDSNIIPDDDITYDLGTSEQQWRELFVQDISASNDVFIDNDLLVSANGTIGTDFRVSGATVVGGYTELSGTLDVKRFTTLHDDLSVIGDMYVDGNVFLSGGQSGKIVFGTDNTDNVIFNADVDSNIIPDDDVTYDLGTSTQQWRELFVQDISATNDVFIDNDLLVSANGTIGTDFRVSGHTTVGGDTVLSGTLDVKEFTTLHDDLSVKGDLYVDGNAYLSAGVDGNIYVGDVNTDNVIFRADVDSNIIPDDDVTFDLGTNTQQWRELFVQDVSASNDVFVDNDLLVSANGTIGTDFRVSGATVVGGYTELSGTLDVKNFTTLHDDLSVIGDMYVDGNVFLSGGQGGDIYLGTDNTDNVIFNADVDSNIIPDDDVTFDLGTSTQQWRELFVQDISASNDIFVDNDLLVSANGTIGTDFRVSGATVVGGYTELSGTLDVKDFTTLHDDLSVIGDMYVDGNVFLSGGQSGDIYLGTGDDDNVIFNADVNSNIIPESTLTFDLGTDNKHWNTLYVHDVSASNNIRVSNTLYTDFIRTDNNNFLQIAAGMDDTAGSFIRLFKDNRMFLHADQFNFGDVFESTDSYRPWVLQVFTDTQHINMDSTLNVVDDATFNSDVWIKGDLRVDGNAWLSAGVNGVVYVGDTNTDNVVFRADVDSNIIPDDDTTYDLGTSTQQWRELFVQDISATRDIFVDNDLLVSANGTIGADFRVSGHTTVGGNTVLSGTLDVDDATFVHDTFDVELKTTLHSDLLVSGNTHIVGDLRVDGNAYLSAGVDGIINVGDTSTDNVVFHADIDSGLTPNRDVTFDLGTSTQQWRELFVQDVSATRDIFVDNDLLVSANGTIGADFRVSGHTTVSGNTVLSGTLDVKDFVTFYDDLSVRGDLYVDGNAYLSAGASGNIYVGDTDGDNVIFRADINSDLIPEQHHTFDIGTDDKHWNTLFVNDVSANGDVKINQTLFVDKIQPDASGIVKIAAGSDDFTGAFVNVQSTSINFHGDNFLFGDIREATDNFRPWILNIDTDDQTTTLDSTLTVTKDATFRQNVAIDGDLTIGNNDSDSVNFNADVISNITPNADVTYDLGTNTKQWRELFVQDISASGDIFVDNNLSVSGDFAADGNTMLGGDVEIQNDLTVSGHVSAVSGMTLTGDLTANDDVFIKGSIVVEGHAYFGYGTSSSQIHLGDPNVDEIVLQAEIGSDIIPYPSSTFDLGTLSKKWRKLYVKDIHSSGKIETMNDVSLSGSMIQTKNIAVDEFIQTREDIWRVQSGRPWNETFDVETFDSTKYQSVQYTVMAISDANITTVNATFVCDGTSINGTVYGTTNVGTVDPIVDLDVVNLNGKYTVKITLSPYAKAMITGKAMFLQ